LIALYPEDIRFAYGQEMLAKLCREHIERRGQPPLLASNRSIYETGRRSPCRHAPDDRAEHRAHHGDGVHWHWTTPSGESAAHVTSYLGRVMREDSSGEYQHRGRILRSAHPHVQSLRVQAAWRLSRC